MKQFIPVMCLLLGFSGALRVTAQVNLELQAMSGGYLDNKFLPRILRAGKESLVES